MIYSTSDMRIARQLLSGDPARAADVPPDSAAIITMHDADGRSWSVVRDTAGDALRQLDVISMQRGNYLGTTLAMIQIGAPLALLRSRV